MLSAGTSRPQRLLHSYLNVLPWILQIHSLCWCFEDRQAFCSIESGSQIWPSLRKPNSFWKVLDSCQDML